MSMIETILARVPRWSIIPTFTLAWLMVQPGAAQQPVPEVLEYKGIVAAAREAEVAPRIDGLLNRINFTAGQLVKQGDLLFEFATRDKELTLALAQATAKQAEADRKSVV